jgi:hypothetical protein
MSHILTVWVVKSVAAAYGFFALGLAILYSLSRADTWRKPTEIERKELQGGMVDQSIRRLYLPD